MKNRGIKGIVMLALVCALVMAFAIPLGSAASYSKVYGQTADRVRVRESASTNAAIIDNIVKGACVYVTSSKASGSMTFIKVNYRALDGDVESGWVCQSDSDSTYVKILSGEQAKKAFSVSGGNLPSRKVGTFTDAQRKASTADSSNTYIKSDSNGQGVKDVQTKLKALGYYSGSISGNVGPLTEEAIKEFQRKNGLTADGIAGPQTIAKLDAVYSAQNAGGTSDGSIRLGSTGSAVRDLQTDLTTLGYYWAEITGRVGSKTEAAIKAFQKDYGLTADGIAGKKTLDAIAAAIKRNGGSSSSSVASSGTALKLNSKGDSVAQMQRDLTTLGYYYAEITGNFGSKTEAAVKAFQKAKGLTVDGIAGKKTLDAIAVAVGGSSSGSSSGSAGGMRLGSTGSNVTALQTNLTTLGFYYGDITGRFGSLTEQAVKKFQKSRGITQDGIAGAKTVAAIENAIRNNGGTVADGTGAGTALREGDRGAAVLEMQELLEDLGFYYGELTGHYGDLTKQAVRKFQEKYDLTVDGIAGTKTLNKLYSVAGKSSGSTSSSTSGTGTTVKTEDSYGQITKNNVYLRSSYSTTSAAKASLKQGKLVRVTKKVTSGEYVWYYITVSVGQYTYTGYVRSDMMKLISESDYNAGGGDSNNSAGDSETLGMIKVTGNNVSMRFEPSTSAERVGTANKGDVFYYVDTVSGWYQTKSGYWISKTYAEVMSDDEVDDYVVNTQETYRYDDTHETVGWIQQMLTDLGYYKAQISNHFGAKTETAVKEFQKDNGLKADGVVGPKTLEKLISVSAKGSNANASITAGSTIYNMDWFTAKNSGVFSKIGLTSKKTAVLTDLTSGKSFNIHIQSTGYHADVEPLKAEDTATMLRIYNVTTPNKISWQARPMLLTIGSYQIVCSIYGEPHGAEDIKDNNYDGQFCLHFTGSKTHNSSSTLDRHIKAISQAATIVTGKGATVKVLDDPTDLQ